MLLICEDEHKLHLEYLTTLQVDVVREFIRISIEFIKNGTNTKVYSVAAQKLGVEAATVQNTVEALIYLFLEFSRLSLTESDVRDSLKGLGFTSPDLEEEIVTRYQENKSHITSVASDMSLSLPRYHDLEWRLDIQLASRSIRRQVEPVVVLKLHTTGADQSPVSQVLGVEPTDLLHITENLEEALQELKTAHCKRIVRNL